MKGKGNPKGIRDPSSQGADSASLTAACRLSASRCSIGGCLRSASSAYNVWGSFKAFLYETVETLKKPHLEAGSLLNFAEIDFYSRPFNPRLAREGVDAPGRDLVTL